MPSVRGVRRERERPEVGDRPARHVGEGAQHLAVLHAVDHDASGPAERQELAQLADALAHGAHDGVGGGDGLAVEDAQHAGLLADGDGGQVPRRRCAEEQGSAGRRTVRDDGGVTAAEGEREADRTPYRHGVVPGQLEAERDPRHAYVATPPRQEALAHPLAGLHPVAQGLERQLDQVAEVAPLPPDQAGVGAVDVGQERRQVAVADRLGALVEHALLQGPRRGRVESASAGGTGRGVGGAVVAAAGEQAEEQAQRQRDQGGGAAGLSRAGAARRAARRR